MSTGVREEARTVWRRELATSELHRLLGPLNLIPHAASEEESKRLLQTTYSMFSEGLWDAAALLEEADRFLEFVGPPEAERMSGVLGPMLRALSSGEAPSEYIHKKIYDLSEANRGRLTEMPVGLEKAKGYLLAYLDLARVGADAASCEAMCLLQEEVSDELVADVVREWKEAVRSAREGTALTPDTFWNICSILDTKFRELYFETV